VERSAREGADLSRRPADVGIGLPYLIARVLSLGAGSVLAVTYEYGNTFVIVAGLLNLLVACDAWDLAAGRK
jgi:hypothetical protein